MNDVIIVNRMPFPEGYAPTKRFTAYSHGLIENGIPVHVLCIKPSELGHSVKNKVTKGNYQGIDFEYTSGTTIRNKFLPVRPLINLKGYIISLCRIVALAKQNHVKAVILIGPFGTLKEIGYYLVTRFAKVKYIQERTEYPFITKKNNLAVRVSLYLYHNISCRLFDGMMLISDVLAEYFGKFVPKEASLCIIPIVVDTERFDKQSSAQTGNEYAAYCGSMNSNKDGIVYLIDAFAVIAPKFPDLSLKLIGRTDFSDFDSLRNKINKLGLNNRIHFTGRVTNEEMTTLLKNAKILVLARPETIQSQANFPTKVGEYCATGKPIVMTRVGAITEYFIDGKNAFLAEPGNSASFAAKMEEALSDYTKALIVGAEAKRLASTVFNYAYQGKMLADWLRKL
jgi:glycosyltransferase involved in cell wall biosynthesis